MSNLPIKTHQGKKKKEELVYTLNELLKYRTSQLRFLLTALYFLTNFIFFFFSFDSRKNSIVLRTQLSVRVNGIMGKCSLKFSSMKTNSHNILFLFWLSNIFFFGVDDIDKLLHSEGKELRRALFSLKQIFQVGLYLELKQEGKIAAKPRRSHLVSRLCLHWGGV